MCLEKKMNEIGWQRLGLKYNRQFFIISTIIIIKYDHQIQILFNTKQPTLCILLSKLL